jgi:23S rRNA pseudouridine1911/1915/1917 synthase
VEIPVEGDAVGTTLAAVVRHGLPDCTWNRARGLVRRGPVLVDGAPATDPAARLSAGAVVQVLARSATATPGDGPRILHVDRDVVVVDKPAGIITVPFEGHERDTLVHRVGTALRRRFGASPPLRVVSRLDKDTSGAIVFARTKRAQRELQRQFKVHDVERRYLAVALGDVASATVRTHLVSDRGDGLRGSWRGGAPPRSARLAVTHLQTLATAAVSAPAWVGAASGTVSLVSCRLETGRQHQIRIHLAEAGHPLVGERVYLRPSPHAGPLDVGTLRGFEPPGERPLLHAHTLSFAHPADGRSRRFVAPIPDDFEVVFAALGWAAPAA